MDNSIYHPLVSIRILTYNSSKYIIDALEGAKGQTYDNVEIIVSDDCSTDNTVAICEEWLNENKSRFVNAVLLTTPVNTGTASNSNRALKSCKGEWVKCCAGDDMLCPNCIETYVKYIAKNPEVKWVSSRIQQYKDTFEEANAFDYTETAFNSGRELYNKDANAQLLAMVHANFISAPACFYNVETLRSIGGCTEKYTILEDTPTFTKLLKHGIKCYYIDEVLVKQRVCSDNVCSNTSRMFSPRLRQMNYMHEKDECFVYYSDFEKSVHHTRVIVSTFIDKIGLNHNNPICEFIYHSVNVSMRYPIHLLHKMHVLDY